MTEPIILHSFLQQQQTIKHVEENICRDGEIIQDSPSQQQQQKHLKQRMAGVDAEILATCNTTLRREIGANLDAMPVLDCKMEKDECLAGWMGVGLV